MAAIQTRPRSDGSTAYRVMFRIRGRQVSETFDTADQAAYFSGLVDRIGGEAALAKRAQAAATSAPTLLEVLDDYIAAAPDITPGTAGEYRRVLVRSGLSDTLGALPVDLIDRRDVETWVQTRAAQTTARSAGKDVPELVSPKTLRNEHGLLSTLLAHAVSRGWTTANAAKGVRLPKRETAELEILTDAQFLALHRAMTDRYKPLVWLLAATGIRWGEATALQWKHVSETSIRIAQAWKHDAEHGRELGAPKTRRAHRTVETLPEVIASLGKRGAPGAYVFTNAAGRPVLHSTFTASHWKPTAEAAGITPPPTIHGLRHFAASHMLSQGADIFEVSRALGRESVTTTSNVYGHLVPSRTRPTAVHAARLQGLLEA